MKTIKILSISLGLMSLAFGVLKFVSPFKDWYATQIETSGLPRLAYSLGILGEILIGIAFLFPYLITVTSAKKRLLLILANSGLILMMMAATVVHVIPEVPASVLPLKIKPPIIPLIVLAIAGINLRASLKPP